MSDEEGSPGSVVAPSYDEYYYEHYEGGSYERSPQWTAFFGGVADQIVSRLQPTSVLDAGCAIGLLVEALADRGVDAHGVDISDWAIRQVPESLADRCVARSLAEPLERRFDLIVSIEVIEHIEEAELQAVLDNLCAATDRLLISSTPLHYEDPTHINIKQPERWSAEFARRGFVRDLGFDASFLTPWSALYVRTNRPWPQVIEDYDRQYWYDRREILTTRTGILRAEQDLRSAREQLASGTSRDAAQQQVEIMRLRDELRLALAEKGAAEGEAERLRREVTDVRNASKSAVRELEAMRRSRTWKLGRMLLAPWRSMTGRA